MVLTMMDENDGVSTLSISRFSSSSSSFFFLSLLLSSAMSSVDYHGVRRSPLITFIHYVRQVPVYQERRQSGDEISKGSRPSFLPRSAGPQQELAGPSRRRQCTACICRTEYWDSVRVTSVTVPTLGWAAMTVNEVSTRIYGIVSIQVCYRVAATATGTHRSVVDMDSTHISAAHHLCMYGVLPQSLVPLEPPIHFPSWRKPNQVPPCPPFRVNTRTPYAVSVSTPKYQILPRLISVRTRTNVTT